MPPIRSVARLRSWHQIKTVQVRCAAFLFDLDGVLVDSRAVVERTCRRWALRHQLDPEAVLRIAHGRRSRDTVKAAAPHLETDRDAAWNDAVELADIEGLSAVPGSPELLAALPPTSWARSASDKTPQRVSCSKTRRPASPQRATPAL